MAELHELEARISSGENLYNVNYPNPLKPVAVVSVQSGPSLRIPAEAGSDHICAKWNTLVRIRFDTPINESKLHLQIEHDGAAEDTPLAGWADLPLSEVVNKIGLGNSNRTMFELSLVLPFEARPTGMVKIAARVCKLAVSAEVLEDDVMEGHEEMEH